jgi:mannose/cellobiose epimerase-like protein (N-acyl-D-glucosamine 2-epimerase family)
MSADPYADWQPLLLEQVSIETLRGPAYRRFIHESAIVPGCRLLLARSRRKPDWPYVETKFNPNTGRDLPPEKYALVHTWFLGRGSEALDDHLRRLDRIEGFEDGERAAVRALFERLIANMTQALVTLARRYHGRIPFRVTRDLAAVDAQGRPVAVDASRVSAADIFAVKGLLSSADPAVQRRALELLQRAAALIRMDRYETDQVATAPNRRGHGMRMLMQGVGSCFSRKALDPASRGMALEIAAGMLGEALDAHFDPKTAVFSEYVDRATGERETLLDPGHANELAGLGLGMADGLTGSELAGRHAALMARARRDLPRLLLKSTALGYNARHPGLYKSVDNRTGEPVDRGMPWWNLPETMRAAAYGLAVAESDSQRAQLLEVFRLSHNAYFAGYPNRALMLFPHQTLDGDTGKVVDVVPAVPEGDPLYHANGAFLDMLDVLGRL